MGLPRPDTTRQTRSPSTATCSGLRRAGWGICFTEFRGKLRCPSLLSGHLMPLTLPLEVVLPVPLGMDILSRVGLVATSVNPATQVQQTPLPACMEEEWRFLTFQRVLAMGSKA